MGLATYDDLKAAVADWLDREDLAGRTGDFITLAEARLNRLMGFSGLTVRMALEAGPGQAELAALSLRRTELETRAYLLRDESISADLLDERARALLGFTDPRDYVIRVRP